MASVTVNLPFLDALGRTFRWIGDVDIGSAFALNGNSQSLILVQTVYAGPSVGIVGLSLEETNNRFTADFEATGRIIFEASDGEMLEVMIANADMTEPYSWVPANSAEVITWANHARGLTDRDVTLTLTDDPPTTTTTYEVRVKATAIGFTDSRYSDPPETIDVTT